MSILDKLASKVGDRANAPNRMSAELCLADPSLLEEVVAAMETKDMRLLGDCAEVMTMVAEENPALVAPYAKAIKALLSHKNGRVRWEATHAMALIAGTTPKEIAPLLPSLAETIRHDASVIVRDYAVDMAGNYAGTGGRAAKDAYPILKEALTLWDGKHAARALSGLGNVAGKCPDLAGEIAGFAGGFAESPKASVRTAARRLLKKLQG